jgi:O-antigen/teichoic acid export membrane protein
MPQAALEMPSQPGPAWLEHPVTLNRLLHLLGFATAAAAALVLGSVTFESARALTGHCDGKFGCVGGVWFGLLVAVVAASISSCALLLVTYLRAEDVSELEPRVLAFIGTVEGLGLTALLRTVGHWPFQPLVSAGVWALISAAFGLALVSLAGLRRRQRLRT